MNINFSQQQDFTEKSALRVSSAGAIQAPRENFNHYSPSHSLNFGRNASSNMVGFGQTDSSSPITFNNAYGPVTKSSESYTGQHFGQNPASQMHLGKQLDSLFQMIYPMLDQLSSLLDMLEPLLNGADSRQSNSDTPDDLPKQGREQDMHKGAGAMASQKPEPTETKKTNEYTSAGGERRSPVSCHGAMVRK